MKRSRPARMYDDEGDEEETDNRRESVRPMAPSARVMKLTVSSTSADVRKAISMNKKMVATLILDLPAHKDKDLVLAMSMSGKETKQKQMRKRMQR